MDKITAEVRHQHWLDIIHACNASGLTKKPGVNRMVSELKHSITGSGNFGAKHTMRG